MAFLFFGYPIEKIAQIIYLDIHAASIILGTRLAQRKFVARQINLIESFVLPIVIINLFAAHNILTTLGGRQSDMES